LRAKFAALVAGLRADRIVVEDDQRGDLLEMLGYIVSAHHHGPRRSKTGGTARKNDSTLTPSATGISARRVGRV
jgi:hypothetical protein